MVDIVVAVVTARILMPFKRRIDSVHQFVMILIQRWLTVGTYYIQPSRINVYAFF